MGDYGSKPLIDHAYQGRPDERSQLGGEFPRLPGGYAVPPGQAGRKANDDFDHLMLGSQAGDLGEISGSAPDCGQRAGKYPVPVAPRDADPCRPDVNREPAARSQRTSLRVAGLEIATNRHRHGLTLRYPTTRCRNNAANPIKRRT